jgi:hypothetical protein
MIFGVTILPNIRITVMRPSKLIDNITESEVIDIFIKQAIARDMKDKLIIADRTKRIAEIEDTLANPMLRNSVREDLIEHRNYYREEINSINKLIRDKNNN